MSLGVERKRAVDEMSEHAVEPSIEPQGLANDLECPLCYKLYYEPVTLGCGHCFCRPCLHRAADFAARCPSCRAPVHVNVSSHPVTTALWNVIQKYFPADVVERRKEECAHVEVAFDDKREQDLVVPFFVLQGTHLMPGQPLHLHVFEPRYRLMMRRCLEGSRVFGVLGFIPSIPGSHSDSDNAEAPETQVGCLVQIHSQQMMGDGRSLIESVGVKRFRIEGDVTEVDGYLQGRVRTFDDGPLTDEAEKLAVSLHDMLHRMYQGMSQHMREEVETQFGPLPPASDPEGMSFYAASVVPVCSEMRAGLLETRSTQERLQLVQSVATQIAMPGQRIRCSIM